MIRISSLLLLTFIITSCSSDEHSSGESINTNADQRKRVDELKTFADLNQINLAHYDYIIIEGRIKCAGCQRVWEKELQSSSILDKSLAIVGDKLELDNPLNSAVGIKLMNFNSIEASFPFIANYFVFYIDSGVPTGYVELGARVFKL